MDDASVDTDAAAVRLAVLDAYAALPATGKPQAGEWSVLAGIALRSASDALEVVALGTGTKCLTAKAIAAERGGGCLHDGHAEVCAPSCATSSCSSVSTLEETPPDRCSSCGRAAATR